LCNWGRQVAQLTGELNPEKSHVTLLTIRKMRILMAPLMIALVEDACMTHPILETALRRAAHWARRGMPHTAAELLEGTDGRLRFRPEYGDLAAGLPGGGEVRVQLSPARRRVTITRTTADYELIGSADLPSHLVDRAA
jgi:hypothetical protein